MSLHVTAEEWERWGAEQRERIAADDLANAWRAEHFTLPGGWRGREAEAEMARKLRGEKVAQEVVTQLAGEINLLRWYVGDLERLLAREAWTANVALGCDVPFRLPPETALLRRMALGIRECDQTPSVVEPAHERAAA